MNHPSDDIDALLGLYTPPSIPAGLAARVTAAAAALPQGGSIIAGRGGRDRGRGWLRRPLIVGGATLGLAFSGAVAATYAGVPLPPKVQAVIAQLPLVSVKPQTTSAPPPAVPTRATISRRAGPAPAEPTVAQPRAAERPFRAFWQSLSPYERRRLRQAPPARRLLVAEQIVENRRAAGLPTPNADRIERAIERRRAAASAYDPVVEERRAERRAIRRARIRADMRAHRDARQMASGAPLIEEPADSRADPDLRASPDDQLEPAWEDEIVRRRTERREWRRAIREERQRRRREAYENAPAESLPEPLR